MKRAVFEWSPFATLKADIQQLVRTLSPEQVSDLQEMFLSEVFDSETFAAFPPHPESTSSFVKKLLLLLEQSGAEIADRLYEQAVPVSADPPWYKTYFDNSNRRLASLVESRELISDGTTGLRTWAAGKFLFYWLQSRPQLLRDKSVLELGCGTGFTGISLLNCDELSFKSLTLTDHHDKVLEGLCTNLRSNFKLDSSSDSLPLSCQIRSKVVSVQVLDWTDFDVPEAVPDLVIGADIVFDTTVIPYLVKTISNFVRSGANALLANCIRDEATDDAFAKELDKAGLKYDRSVHENVHDTELKVPLHLYTIGQ